MSEKKWFEVDPETRAAFREAMDEMTRDLSERYVNSRERALQVRDWRVGPDGDVHGSWRWVAEQAYEAWGGDWDPPSNQIFGMTICELAAKMLGEDPGARPWN